MKRGDASNPHHLAIPGRDHRQAPDRSSTTGSSAFDLLLDDPPRTDCLGDAAREYAMLGVPVFPVSPLQKAPPLVQWSKYATAEVAVVAQWWKRWSRANIGCPTGTLFDVLDIEGKYMDAWLRVCARKGLVFTNALQAFTPSGGIHFYGEPRHVPTRRFSIDGEPFGDYKAVGGYVLLPPSQVHIGGYSWR